MRPTQTPAHSWLTLRIRVLCIGTFAVSMFLPAYTPEVASGAPQDVEMDSRGFLLAEDGFLMKTSSLTEQGTRSAYSEGIIHTVAQNESIASIAKTAFLQPETIRWANNLEENAKIKPGQKLLLLPVDGVLHKVKRGQNAQTIADLYDVDAKSIITQNKISGGYLLAGQELIIPGGKPVIEVIAKVPAAVPVQAKVVAKVSTPAGKVVTPLKNYVIEPSYGIFQMPCDCFYTQYFSPVHFGVDMQHRGGAPVFAVEAGTVTRADYGWAGGYGNVIVIDHGNGVETLYAHNKELYVKKGDKVSRGQPISYMGNTGRVHGPTGIHLHLEVHINGVKKNPLIYLQQ